MRCLIRGWLDSKVSFLSPHCALRGPQRAAWQNRRGSSTGRRGVARPSSHVVTRLPDALSRPLGLSGWDLMGHWTSLECHGEFPGKAWSMSWSPLELLKIHKTGHRRTPELLACAVPAHPRGSAEIPVWGPTCPSSLLPARTVRAGPVPGRFLGLGSGRPWPGGRRMEWRAEAVPGQPPWAPAILMCLLSGPGGEAGCSLLGPGRSGCRGPAAGAGSLSPSLCLLPSTTRQADRHLAGRGNPGRRLG